MVNVSGGKVEVVVLVDIKDLQKLQQAGIKFKQLKKDADAANMAIKQSGDQAAASAVRFQTLTQGAINLTTAFIQTETTISNLTKAKTSLKAAMVGVERAEDLLARKQVQLNQEMRKSIPDQEKIALLTREIATGMKDLEVKEDRVKDQTDQLSDTYKLFALNLLNVSFSAIQTGKAMIDSVPKIKELTKSIKLANLATSKYTLVAIAAVAAWEILVGQLKIFGDEAAKTYSISGQINKIFGDMNVTLKDVTSDLEELTGANNNYNKSIDGTLTKTKELHSAQQMQLNSIREMLRTANDPNTIRALSRQAALMQGASPQDFQSGSGITTTNPPKEAGKNANVSETTTGTSIGTDGQAVFDNNEVTNEILRSGVGAGPGLGPHTFGFLTPALMIAAQHQSNTGPLMRNPLISQDLFMQKNYEAYILRQVELAKGGRSTSGGDIASFIQKTYGFHTQGLTPEQQRRENIYNYLPDIIGKTAIQHGAPTAVNNYGLVLQSGKLGIDFQILSRSEQFNRFADYMAFGNPTIEETMLAHQIAQEVGLFDPQPTKAFKPTAPEDLRTTLEKYPSGSTIGRHIIDPTTGISSLALVNAMVNDSLEEAKSRFDFGTNTGFGLTKDPQRGEILARAISVFAKRNELLQNTPETTPNRYLPRATHRTGIDFRTIAQGVDATLSPMEQAQQAFRLMNQSVNTSFGGGLTQAEIEAGATFADFGAAFKGGAHRFSSRNRIALQQRKAQINVEDDNRNKLRTGGVRNNKYPLWDPRAVEGGYTSIGAARNAWREEFEVKRRNATTVLGSLGISVGGGYSARHSQGRAINQANSISALMSRTGLSLSQLPSESYRYPKQRGGGWGNIGGAALKSLQASFARRFNNALASTIASNQNTLARAGQIDTLIGGFGLDEFFGSALSLLELQERVKQQDALIKSIGLNRTEAFRIIDTGGRGREEIDDRILWTQRNTSISTGVAVI